MPYQNNKQSRDNRLVISVLWTANVIDGAQKFIYFINYPLIAFIQ